jgi:hypothetical protein
LRDEKAMHRVPAADDFETIRLRLEELRRERAQRRDDGSLPHSPQPEAVARQSAVADRRTPLAPRRLLRTRFWNVRKLCAKSGLIR